MDQGKWKLGDSQSVKESMEKREGHKVKKKYSCCKFRLKKTSY